MPRLSIRHETLYTYDRPVTFGPHRLLLRPRDSHAIRLLEASLELYPPGQTHWQYDAHDNCVCLFTPDGPATQLRIVSQLLLERFPAPLAVPVPDDPHTTFPVIYAASDRLALAPFINPTSDEVDPTFLGWLRDNSAEPGEALLSYVQRLNRTIFQQFQYVTRYVEGVQSPEQTLLNRSGSCRDFAWLMVEALRRQGFATRFVTGYLYSHQADCGIRGAGATHAWCEAFLPSLGWLEFDPTNGLVESPDLIRVATALTPADAAPVSGSLMGDPGASNLTVNVTVTLADDPSTIAA
ncbi:MAG: transglutaminase family protein [Caulobacteraceae bacterium]|nr:transglutaminase family protein [Caulobacteraceae bacterium]